MQYNFARGALLAPALLLAAFAALAVEGQEHHDQSQQVPAPEAAQPQRKIKYYRNPMGQPDTSPTPKKDSMGMDYIPVYVDEAGTGGGTVTLSPEKIQRTGVETAAVAKRALARTIHAPGTVQLDERRVSVIAPRFDGFVEKVGEATSGAHVKKGEPLVTVFGQALLDQGARLILEEVTTPSRARLQDATPSELAQSQTGVIGAGRRLRNLGAPEDFIARIRRDKAVPDTVELTSPLNGVVLERNAIDGQAFKAGDVLFRLADHSHMWMLADIAEGDIDATRPGQSVTVTARARPGRTFEGTVDLIYPHLMKETRTARVRIELPNLDLALLPDMYGDVAIATGATAEVIAAPDSAVLNSGTRQIVLLDKGDGRYEPRDVTLGRHGDGFTEVKSGLAEGDRIVVNGTFLIDAESNLQSALQSLTAAAAPEPAP